MDGPCECMLHEYSGTSIVDTLGRGGGSSCRVVRLIVAVCNPARSGEIFCLFVVLSSQEAALGMKLRSQYIKGLLFAAAYRRHRDDQLLTKAAAQVYNTCFTNKLYACVRLMNIDYLIAEKWSGQNRTSRTGSAAPVGDIVKCPV